MSLTVLCVVLLAAVLHASWNFLVKRSHDPHLGMTAVVLGHAPFALAAIVISPAIDPRSAPYLVAGALLHCGYQWLLLASYRVGDLSHVYPIARGTAPLIVATVSVALLGADLSAAELTSVAVIGLGIMSLALVRYQDGLRNPRAALLALATGGFIAAYSLVDGLGARLAGTALGFYGWLSLLNALFFAPFMFRLRPQLFRELTRNRPGLLLASGGASFFAYALVVWAFTQAPIALVTAVRETSIIFALLMGVLILKERLSLAKLLATLVTLIGVALLRVGR